MTFPDGDPGTWPPMDDDAPLDTGERMTRSERITARLKLADKHETMALALSEHFDKDSVTKAASHFAVADALRARARLA